MNIRNHICLAYLVRLAVIKLGALQDKFFEVPYTDIDYKVFTDAAANVLQQKSPFDRDTYRYSPLLAYLLTTNVLISPFFGKIIFSIFDCIIAVLIQKILRKLKILI